MDFATSTSTPPHPCPLATYKPQNLLFPIIRCKLAEGIDQQVFVSLIPPQPVSFLRIYGKTAEESSLGDSANEPHLEASYRLQ